MEAKDNKFGIRQITITAILLAICMISQIFKNVSVFITGPIVNTCIVLAVLLSGLVCGIILAVITPVTAFLISGAPVMQAVPLIIPFIMLGNVVLAVAVHFLFKPAVKGTGKIINPKAVLMAVVSALIKGLVMGVTISLWLLPTFIPAESPLAANMSKLQMTFGVFQFITCLIGFVYVFIVLIPLRKDLENYG